MVARPRRSHLELTTLDELRRVLKDRKTLRGIRIQDLDLTTISSELLRRDVAGLVVLGGLVPERVAAHLRRGGAVVFPADPDAPVNVYRSTLYQPADLYAGLDEGGYPATPDCRAYDWAKDASLAGDVLVTLLRAIHDDSMTDALDESLTGARVAGVMGGHAVARGTAEYAATAGLGHRLAEAGLVVVTGGGPGAMEAANLGAFARHTYDLEQALERLGAVPSFAPDVGAWARLALEVRADLRADAPSVLGSVGIPTWFYGHEPPNVFCDGIGKYFSNALREDGLLSRCNAGIVVMPGAAGTVQEIFQAVTPIYYAALDVVPPPLVLVGVRHWTEQVPLWPVVRSLVTRAGRSQRVHLVDDPAEAATLLAE